MWESVTKERKKSNTVSTGSLEKYTEVLTDSQIYFIKNCISEMNLKLIGDFYPSLVQTKKRKIKPFVMKLFSNLDYCIFLRKNIKSLEIRE